MGTWLKAGAQWLCSLCLFVLLSGKGTELLSQPHGDLVVTNMGYNIESAVPANPGLQISLKRPPNCNPPTTLCFELCPLVWFPYCSSILPLSNPFQVVYLVEWNSQF